jgi:hypothetical protein
MNNSPTPLASTARLLLNDLIERHADPFDELPSTAFFFNASGQTMNAVTAGDPYSCLQELAQLPFPARMSGIAVANAGWAAATSQTPPSQSPDRRRVVILMVISRDFSRETAITAEGAADFPNDAGAGDGPLADAIESALLHSLLNGL